MIYLYVFGVGVAFGAVCGMLLERRRAKLDAETERELSPAKGMLAYHAYCAQCISCDYISEGVCKCTKRGTVRSQVAFCADRTLKSEV